MTCYYIFLVVVWKIIQGQKSKFVEFEISLSFHFRTVKLYLISEKVSILRAAGSPLVHHSTSIVWSRARCMADYSITLNKWKKNCHGNKGSDKSLDGSQMSLIHFASFNLPLPAVPKLRFQRQLWFSWLPLHQKHQESLKNHPAMAFPIKGADVAVRPSNKHIVACSKFRKNEGRVEWQKEGQWPVHVHSKWPLQL